MAKRKVKKKVRQSGGSFLKKVQNDRSVKAVKLRIKKAKAVSKKLSAEYKRKLKAASRRLAKKRR